MGRDRTRYLIGLRRWRIVVATGLVAVVAGACIWVVLTDAPAYRSWCGCTLISTS